VGQTDPQHRHTAWRTAKRYPFAANYRQRVV